MHFDRRTRNTSTRGFTWIALVALSALLLGLGLAGGLSRFQALAQPVDEESVQSPVAPTAVITSQIRAPNKDAHITERGSTAVSGIAWGEGTDPPYITDDVFLSIERTTSRAYLLSWSSLPSASYYVVEEAADQQFKDSKTIYFGENTVYPHTQSGDGTYYYRVKAAETGVTDSRWSNVVAVTVPWLEGDASALSAGIDATSAVTVEVRIGEPDEIEITDWETAEVVETTWGGWEWSYAWDLPETRETQYLIQARASDGEDSFGAVDAITVTVDNQIFFAYLPVLARRWPPIPYSPELEEINNPNEWVEYTLDWSYTHPGTDVPAPQTYTVEEADNASFANAETYTVPSAQTSLEIRDEQQEKHNGTYYYRVRGDNAYGPGEWSNVEMTTLRVTPRAPSLKPVDKADEETSYTVRWTYDHAFPADQPTSYVLEEAANAAFTVGRQQYEVKDGTSKVFKNKSEGTYYYRVRGKNSYGLGAWSNTVGPVKVETFSYFDDFSDVDSGWPALVDGQRWAFYEVDPNPPLPDDDSPYPRDGNAYFIARRSSSPPRGVFGPGVAVPSSDYKIEVDTRWWDARWYATYQILFGADKSLSNYYAVRVQMNDINNICRFSVVRVTSGGTAVLNGQWEDRRVINCGERRYNSETPWNHWVIRREDGWIRVHVNGTFLGEWKDSTYGANRYFGVRSTLYEGFTPSKPEFDNWSVELLD